MAVESLLKNEFRAVDVAPAKSLLNTLGWPPKWKARSEVAWQLHQFRAAIFANYVNSYRNALTEPSQSIASWTTVDTSLGYDTGDTGGELLPRNLTVGLNIQNLANRRPPYAAIPASFLLPGQNSPPQFDAANASPLGRVWSVTLNKRW
jgi:outer membrane receptor protein involved in Fe transport